MAKQSFENAMKQLEDIVQELEGGNLPLERAIKKFEEGMKLSRFCTDLLDETEKRIQVLVKDAQGNICEHPFPESNNSADS
jgi:exodeoxyribonuclease VII small subunit